MRRTEHPLVRPPGGDPSPARSHRARWILGGLACLALLAHALFYLNQTCDDVFISLRYARNLAAGDGLVFNPGLRDEGYSNLAWVLLLALGARLGAEPLIMAKLLSLAAAAGVALLLCLPERAQAGARGGPGSFEPPLAAWLLALSPHFCFWSAAGLETAFFALLCLGLVLLVGRPEPTRGARLGAPALAALAAWTRPEGALLGLLAATHELARGPAPRRRQALALAASALGAVGAQTLFRLAYYGELVPNPYRSKVEGIPFSTAAAIGIHYVRVALGEAGGLLLGPLALCALLLRGRERLPTLAATLLVGYTGLFTIPAGGDYMRGGRFLVPVLPLLFLLAERGAAALAGRAGLLPDRRRAFGFALSLACLALLLGADPIPRSASFYETRSLAPRNAHRRVAAWLAEHAAPTESALLSEMGIIPYYSTLRYYDTWGLVDRRAYRSGSRELDHGRLIELDAGLAVLTTVRGSEGRRAPDRTLLAARWFHLLYEEVARFPILRDEDEESSRYYLYSPTTRPDEIEFVIFRRRAARRGAG
jgi:hypothetical protein